MSTSVTPLAPPYEGRDDDIMKLEEILNLVVKHGSREDIKKNISCGPDHKIGCNLFKLKKQKKFQELIVEMPCLQFRKSLIGSLFAAPKHSGLVQLLQYARDQDAEEWQKMLNPGF